MLFPIESFRLPTLLIDSQAVLPNAERRHLAPLHAEQVPDDSLKSPTGIDAMSALTHERGNLL